MNYLIDSSAWIDYFIGSDRGLKLNTLLFTETDTFFTIEPCLAEIHAWSIKHHLDFSVFLSIIRANSELLSLSEQNWIDAGKERYEQRKKQKDFGLIDATLVVKQKEINCKIVSSDVHFRQLKNTVFI